KMPALLDIEECDVVAVPRARASSEAGRHLIGVAVRERKELVQGGDRGAPINSPLNANKCADPLLGIEWVRGAAGASHRAAWIPEQGALEGRGLTAGRGYCPFPRLRRRSLRLVGCVEDAQPRHMGSGLGTRRTACAHDRKGRPETIPLGGEGQLPPPQDRDE